MTYSHQPYAGNASLGDLDSVDASGNTPIPAGDYNVRAVEIGRKPTSNGRGEMITTTFEVIDGQYAGRKIFENFNIRNDSTQTVQIALRHLKQWLLAAGDAGTGQLTFDRVMQLQGRPVVAKVKIEKDRAGQYDDKNRVARFVAAAPAGAPAAPQAGVMPPPAATAAPAPTAPTYPPQTHQQPAPPAAAAPAPAYPAQPPAHAQASAPAPLAPPPAAPAAPTPPAAPAAAPPAPAAPPPAAPPPAAPPAAAPPAAPPAPPAAGGVMPWEQ